MVTTYTLQGRVELKKSEVMVTWCFTPLFNPIWLYMAVSFHSWRNTLFLGVNQQPSVSNWQLPLMGFELQRRGASSDAFTTRPRRHQTKEDNDVLTTYIYLRMTCFTKHMNGRCLWEVVSLVLSNTCCGVSVVIAYFESSGFESAGVPNQKG